MSQVPLSGVAVDHGGTAGANDHVTADAHERGGTNLHSSDHATGNALLCDHGNSTGASYHVSSPATSDNSPPPISTLADHGVTTYATDYVSDHANSDKASTPMPTFSDHGGTTGAKYHISADAQHGAPSQHVGMLLIGDAAPRVYCSVPKSTSNSSKRIKAAMMAGMVWSFNERKLKLRRLRMNKKKKKLAMMFAQCPPVSKQFCWTAEQIDEYYLVVDGSAEGNKTCSPPKTSKKKVMRLSIQRGDLFVPDVLHSSMGLVHLAPDRPNPYRLIPRNNALKATHLFQSKSRVNELCSAFESFEKAQRKTLKRGFDIFGENKYVCAGKQPGRASVGVHDTYHLSRVSTNHLEAVVKYVRNLEHLFEEFAESEVVTMVQEARKLLNYPTFQGAGRECQVFSSFAFGRNVYLPTHVDRDFTYSIISVHTRGGFYSSDCDGIVAYFCFPRLGVAVPLRPGDVLLINPLEPHSISSRRYESDEIFCFSAYLKSSIVGLNDNKLQLCPRGGVLAKEYHCLFNR